MLPVKHLWGVYCRYYFKLEIISPTQMSSFYIKVWVSILFQSFTKRVPAEKVQGSRPSSADNQSRGLKRQRSYCIQISKEEYEREAKEMSKKAVCDLLTSIQNDTTLHERERNKRLKQVSVCFVYFHKNLLLIIFV